MFTYTAPVPAVTYIERTLCVRPVHLICQHLLALFAARLFSRQRWQPKVKLFLLKVCFVLRINNLQFLLELLVHVGITVFPAVGRISPQTPLLAGSPCFLSPAVDNVGPHHQAEYYLFILTCTVKLLFMCMLECGFFFSHDSTRSLMVFQLLASPLWSRPDETVIKNCKDMFPPKMRRFPLIPQDLVLFLDTFLMKSARDKLKRLFSWTFH